MDKEIISDLLRHDQTNDLVSEVLSMVLQVPGVQEAVALAALNDWKDREMKYLYNQGCTDLGNVPYVYLWNKLIGLEV